MALFEGKQNVHLYVRFLAKLGAPLSSELLNTLVSRHHNPVRVSNNVRLGALAHIGATFKGRWRFLFASL